MRSPVEISVTRDIPVEMRDGTVLYTDLYRPAGGGRYPVLLQRTPYNKQMHGLSLLQTDVFRAVHRGYAVVIQDCRGRYASDGDFAPFIQENEDGFDAVEWCGGQPWSTGKVGMFGTSYVGATQWLAAVATPPSLKCIVPAFTSSDYYEGWTYQGGAFQWGFMTNWVLPYLTAADLYRNHQRSPLPDYEEQRQKLVNLIDDMDETVKTLPLRDLPVDRELSPYFFEWLDHPTSDDWWKERSIEERHSRVAVPAFNVGGWFDIFLDGTTRNFNGVRARGATHEARSGSRLMLGPWTHTTPPLSHSGAVDFGFLAGQGLSPITMDIDGEYLRFFDLWLKDEDDGFSQEPPIKVFVMGEGTWRSEHEWPLARTQFTQFYLHSGGNANSSAGDGSLSTLEPGAERPDRFLYDPFHPVPTAGGQLCCLPARLAPGMFDQSGVELRSDVLIFVTEPLDEEVEVTGPVTLTLWASTSAPDTDFTGKLVDIDPQGRAWNLTDGIIRARYRHSTEKAEFVNPGEPVEYRIDLWSTSNLFRKGHRIGLEVASSNFPRFDRNLNTGGELGADAEMAPALQTVFHDQERPSHLTLPIIPRG